MPVVGKEIGVTLGGQRAEERYDPSQLRGPDGRWIDVGALLADLRKSGAQDTLSFDDDRYFDWSTRPDGDTWTFEIGDGEDDGDVLQLNMSRQDMAGLHGALTEALDYNSEDPGMFSPADQPSGRYFDWSIVEEDEDGDETLTFEAGTYSRYEGDVKLEESQSVQVAMSRQDMAELHSRLTMTLLADASDDERGPLVDSLRRAGYVDGVVFDDGDQVDWSIRGDDGTYQFDVSDADGGVLFDLPQKDFARWHDWLTGSLDRIDDEAIIVSEDDGDERAISWEPLDADGEWWAVRFTDVDGEEVEFEWPMARMQRLHNALTASMIADGLDRGPTPGTKEALLTSPAIRLMLLARATESGFNPSQLRGPDGRWISMGGAAKRASQRAARQEFRDRSPAVHVETLAGMGPDEAADYVAGLRGKRLDDTVRAAGLPKGGTAAKKRHLLVQHAATSSRSKPSASPDKAERDRIAKQLVIRMAAGERFDVEPDIVPHLMDALGDSGPVNLSQIQISGPGNESLFQHHVRDIPRDQMPALPDNVAALVPLIQELGRRGIKAKLIELDPRDIVATQSQLSGPKVAKMAGFMRNGWRPGGAVIVSEEGALLDGHHRWAGAAVAAVLHEQGVPGYQPVKVTALQVDLGIDELLQVGEQFSGPKKSLQEAP